MTRKWGLVLGGGSARGLSHIGILKVLEKNNLRPDYVSGTSIGAAIGALYCTGMSPEYMKNLCLTTEWQELLDFTVPKTGILAGNKVESLIARLTNNCSFSDLVIPLRVVATDLISAKKVVFSEGNLAKAVRASISIPGIFSPVVIDRHELVDGAIVDPVPVDVVRGMGAEIVVAVDLGLQLGATEIAGRKVQKSPSFLDTMKRRFVTTQVQFFKELILETKKYRLPSFIKKYTVRAVDRFLNPARLYRFLAGKSVPRIVLVTHRSIQIMSSRIYQQELAHSSVDVVIRPKIREEYENDFYRAKDIINAGEEAARETVAKLRKLVS